MTEKKRDIGLDVFKGILVLFMIGTHIIKFFSVKGSPHILLTEFGKIGDLICFSGFIFAYGYSNSIAYFKKEKKDVAKSYFKNFLRLTCVFYVSGIAYRIICSCWPLSCIPKILLFCDFPAYSEYIASYALLTLLVYFFFNPIKRILDKPLAVLITVLISLSFCAFPYQLVNFAPLSLLVGSSQFGAFPVIQYFCLFILGAYAQKVRLDWNFKVFLACLGASAPFYIKTIILKQEQANLRFPVPTAVWITGSFALLYILFLASRHLLSNKGILTTVLSRFGSDIPAALLTSNLALFIFTYVILKTVLVRFNTSVILWMLFSIALFAAIYGWLYYKPTIKTKVSSLFGVKSR